MIGLFIWTGIGIFLATTVLGIVCVGISLIVDAVRGKK